ncbi:MAG: glycine cleavage system aminomethyltransferase GcvT [Candidatus Berkiella sp.]
MEQSTPLYQKHLELGAMMVPFAGWQMPLHYGSQLEEHHFVRKDAGVFDVSHMLAIDIQGEDASAYLRQLLANDVMKLNTPGKALYTCMLNENAGIIDDLIVYRLGNDDYRCVVNAGTAQKDEQWMRSRSQSFNVKLTPRRDLSLLAVQGPKSFEKLKDVLNPDMVEKLAALKPFQLLIDNAMVIAKTGYTGETGVEIMLPSLDVTTMWDKLLNAGVHPIGLAARDSLRLEAGLNLYGTDMDETINPDEANLSWTVDTKDPLRDFIGKEALLAKRKQGTEHQLLGVVLQEKGVCRSHMLVHVKNEQQQWLSGTLTSGGFSPTLNCGIGLARVPRGHFTETELEIRGKRLKAKLITPPFYRATKA